MPYFSADDCQLYYEVTGDGPPLLLLHGLGSSTRDWEAQVPAFAEDFRVVTLDARGHGRSEVPPGPYTIAQFARDAAALLHHLDAAPAHLVGVSMGGMVGLQLAADAPALVRSLTVANSYVEFRPAGAWARFRVWRRRLFVRLFGMRAVGFLLARKLFPRADQARLRRLMTERWAENDTQAYLDSIDAIVGWSIRARLPEITCPTLVLAAEHDYTSVAHKRAYTERLPDARLVVVPGTRHALPVEQPDAFNRAVRSFLRRHQRT